MSDVVQEKMSWITGDIFTSSPSHTSLSAWEPWDYTRSILFDLQNSDIDDDHPEWRIYWFGGVALLRTIGHVLHKVDSAKSDIILKIINHSWQEWHENQDENWVFFDFIECERNNLLKEFSFGAELPSDEDGRTLAYGNTHHDAAQLFREAVYWWRNQLENIELQLKIT